MTETPLVSRYRTPGRTATAADPRATSTIVFLGPTLPVSEAARLIEARFVPPARRGDIYRALRDGFRTIVLIDGEFHAALSVWQREILDALDEGVTVHGAASMGALRAAELHAFGMTGHGRIFEWYRDGVIDGDDEVALIYGPEDLGYPPLSEPLVNIRGTLAKAVPQLITAREGARLIEHAKQMYFPHRSPVTLLAGGPAAAWPARRRSAVADFLTRHWVDQKGADAVIALSSVAGKADGAKPPRMGTPARAPWRRERLVEEGFLPSVRARAGVELGRRLGMSPEALKLLRRRLSALFFVADWARARGLTATLDNLDERDRLPAGVDPTLPRLAAPLRQRALANAAIRNFPAHPDRRDARAVCRGIVLAWARENGIARRGLKGDALVDWIIDAGPDHFGYAWGFEVELAEALLLGEAGMLLSGLEP